MQPRNLASALEAAGKLEESALLYYEELEGCAALHGIDHEETQSSARGLRELLLDGMNGSQDGTRHRLEDFHPGLHARAQAARNGGGYLLLRDGHGTTAH